MKKNYKLEYKLCVNDLLGKVQINSFERVYNTYIWLRKRTSVFKCIAIKLKHYTLGVYPLKIRKPLNIEDMLLLITYLYVTNSRRLFKSFFLENNDIH